MAQKISGNTSIEYLYARLVSIGVGSNISDTEQEVGGLRMDFGEVEPWSMGKLGSGQWIFPALEGLIISASTILLNWPC